jgi:hypothetical protein
MSGQWIDAELWTTRHATSRQLGRALAWLAAAGYRPAKAAKH